MPLARAAVVGLLTVLSRVLLVVFFFILLVMSFFLIESVAILIVRVGLVLLLQAHTIGILKLIRGSPLVTIVTRESRLLLVNLLLKLLRVIDALLMIIKCDWHLLLVW